MNKRDKIFTIALALIVVALLIATPRHPIAAWKGPCYVFCVLTLAWLALREPLADLAARYGSNFALQGLPPLPALTVLAAAGMLGWLGAGLVTGHYLRQTRPLER